MPSNCGTRGLLRAPWTARRSILKEINPEYSLEVLVLKLKLQYFGHLMWRADHWKRPWCWERFRAREEGGNKGWDDWEASLTQWTWVWENLGREWRTVKHGMLQCMGSQIDTTEQLNNSNKASRSSRIISDLSQKRQRWVNSYPNAKEEVLYGRQTREELWLFIEGHS